MWPSCTIQVTKYTAVIWHVGKQVWLMVGCAILYIPAFPDDIVNDIIYTKTRQAVGGLSSLSMVQKSAASSEVCKTLGVCNLLVC